MPQKAFEGGISHVRAYAIFPEMPQNRTYSFSRFQIDHVFFSRSAQLFPSDSENFRKNEHKKCLQKSCKNPIYHPTGSTLLLNRKIV